MVGVDRGGELRNGCFEGATRSSTVAVARERATERQPGNCSLIRIRQIPLQPLRNLESTTRSCCRLRRTIRCELRGRLTEIRVDAGRIPARNSEDAVERSVRFRYTTAREIKSSDQDRMHARRG